MRQGKTILIESVMYNRGIEYKVWHARRKQVFRRGFKSGDTEQILEKSNAIKHS